MRHSKFLFILLIYLISELRSFALTSVMNCYHMEVVGIPNQSNYTFSFVICSKRIILAQWGTFFKFSIETDIDECKLSLYSCHKLAQCVNIPGYYDCRCNTGYGGDGQQYCGGECPRQLYYIGKIIIIIVIVIIKKNNKPKDGGGW